MLRDFTLILLIWFVARFSSGADFPGLYNNIVLSLDKHQTVLLIYGLSGSLLLLAVSFVFSMLNLHTLLYLLSKLFLELSQFAISFISFFAVAIWFDFGRNLWLDLGRLVVLPFTGFLVSCLSIRSFDFNYPLNDKIMSNIAVPLVSVVLVFIASLVLA